MIIEDRSEAFLALKRWLRGESDPAQVVLSKFPPFERLRSCLLPGQASRSPLDIAILIRHVLRYEELNRSGSQAAFVDVCSNVLALSGVDLSTIGLTVDKSLSLPRIKTLEWRPKWLPESEYRSVDSTTMQAQKINQRFPESPGDPFLTNLGFNTYKNRFQKAAVRSVITMPPGGTLVANLPTGDGKSTLFRVINKFGFPDTGQKGLTLVIVPTVVLGIDQEEHFDDNKPLAYVGGEDTRNSQIIENIKTGTQGICFASPEAVCGPLAYALREAVSKNLFKALVIDEAHLVDGWGTGFRTEFQVVSGFRHELLSVCHPQRQFRTLLLSATLTDGSLETLVDLFPSKDFAVVGTPRSRSEIEFWLSETTDVEKRRSQVIEALKYLPRPAILYVTKVSDCGYWKAILKEAGFRNFALVSGETSAVDRREILIKWRKGELDLVIGTSAFGLGVDYKNVRTVIHACIPEDLDRFYQEVGRGGRDRCGCVSLMLPCFDDVSVAKALNKSRNKIISVTRGFERWKAMFSHPDSKQSIDNPKVFNLRLDVAPSSDIDDMDMVGSRSIDWNARVLSLMVRSGIIRMLGDDQTSDKEGIFQSVEIVRTDHLSHGCWNELVAGKRKSIVRSNLKNHTMMFEYLNRSSCLQDLLSNIYDLSLDGHKNKFLNDCNGCFYGYIPPKCSKEKSPPPKQKMPWPSSSGIENFEYFTNDITGVVCVYYEIDQFRKFNVKKNFRDALKILFKNGLNKAVLKGDLGVIGVEVATVFNESTWFVHEKGHFKGDSWPEGPEMLLVGEGEILKKKDYRSNGRGNEKILLIPKQIISEERDIPLLRYFNGPTYDLTSFLRRVVS